MAVRRLAPPERVLHDVPLAIDPAEVRAFHDYKPPAGRAADAVAAGLDRARREVEALVRPAVAYRLLEVARAAPDHLDLAAGPRLHVPAIAAHWGAVEAVAAAVVTVGDGPERAAAARRAAGDDAGASCLDSAGSAAVECLAEWVNDELCRLGVAAGLRVTNRISPGLAGWTLAEQPLLLDLAGAAAVSVRGTAAGTMWPAKSISLLVGIGAAARVDHYFVQCRRCWMVGCPWRRAPATGAVQREA